MSYALSLRRLFRLATVHKANCSDINFRNRVVVSYCARARTTCAHVTLIMLQPQQPQHRLNKDKPRMRALYNTSTKAMHNAQKRMNVRTFKRISNNNVSLNARQYCESSSSSSPSVQLHTKYASNRLGAIARTMYSMQ